MKRASKPVKCCTSLTAVMVLTLMLAACGGGTGTVEGSGEAGTVAAASPDAGERAVAVRVTELQPEHFLERLEVSGTLEPYEEVEVRSENGGLVREVSFEKGRRVSQGDLLCRIGDDLAEARLAQAQAELMGAEANFLKMTKLVERQAVPQQDLVAATAVRDRLLASVRESELMLERSRIHAPISGVALNRPIDTGEVLAPGAMITTLQQVRRLKVAAAVPDTEIRWLRLGGQGVLEVDAWPGREFDVAISFLSPAADRANRTFLVELKLDNRDGALRPGMVSRVRFDRRSVEDGIVIPLDALVTRIEGPAAYVVQDCAAALRQVEIDATEGDRVLVLSGLAAGDLLVVEGQRDLVDGQRVETGDCK
ncbi:MAG: efflux RND transporter periplasmic adaptor subunit [Acidobacteria bacterium]|uniref:Efflux RND transporter periplasmic adaptor subunit n=1 Tax=Candidatus Polarisedimenticola svalbardensis TaxID=2886004 RepID=A0A8J7C3G7_9BACT|nr:efflux RND transporter periplasmic adaptor subunit [Candidatus Polarisedimenticola svalbardensis]